MNNFKLIFRAACYSLVFAAFSNISQGSSVDLVDICIIIKKIIKKNNYNNKKKKKKI